VTTALEFDVRLGVFDLPGPFSFTPPWWCDELDVILLDGGDGGQPGSAKFPGAGGRAGRWSVTTLVRGVDFTDTVSGVVGSGGRGGSSTTAATTGQRSLVNAGQLHSLAIPAPTHPELPGQSPGHLSYHDRTYQGGPPQRAPSEPGWAPGGGGAGSENEYTKAGDGAPGCVYVYAIQRTPRSTGSAGSRSAPRASWHFPPFDEEQEVYRQPGRYDYRIPWWCTAIDAVACSGAGGGEAGGSDTHRTGLNGRGAEPGNWRGLTILRGRDISWQQSLLHIVVGDGGLGGRRGATGHNGGPSRVRGQLVVDGASGAQSPPGGAGPHRGLGAPAFVFGGRIYNGSGNQDTPGGDGLPPAGAGAGGDPGDPGGSGADGIVIMTAYQVDAVAVARYIGISAPVAWGQPTARARYTGHSTPFATAQFTPVVRGAYTGTSFPSATATSSAVRFSRGLYVGRAAPHGIGEARGGHRAVYCGASRPRATGFQRYSGLSITETLAAALARVPFRAVGTSTTETLAAATGTAVTQYFGVSTGEMALTTVPQYVGVTVGEAELSGDASAS
jgi:hypothetical protein